MDYVKHAFILPSTALINASLRGELQNFKKYPDDDTLNVTDLGEELWIALSDTVQLNHLVKWAKENKFVYEVNDN